jgi:hypothetical protein
MPTSSQQPFPGVLAQALSRFRHPDVLGVRLLTTREGGWKIVATVRHGAALPVMDLEALSGEVPVQYEWEPGRIPVARPAYPGLGE